MREHQPDTPSIEELCERVRILEGRRRKRPLVVLALVGAFAATAGAAALVPDTLAAKSFRLVDATGAERAALTASEAGAVSLSVYDAKGAVAAELVLAPTEPLLSVIDARAKRADVPAVAVAPPRAAQAPPPPAAPAQRTREAVGSGGPADDGREEDSFDWMD